MAKDNTNSSADKGASPSSGGSALTGFGPYLGAAGDLVSGLGSAYSSYEAMAGAKAEAGTYREAAALSRQNIQLTEQSVAIEREQQSRQQNLVIGQQRAAVGANSFSLESGSAVDLMAASRSQGAIQRSLISLNGTTKELGYEQQAQAYDAQAQAADAAAKSAEGGIFAGIMKGVLAVAPLLLL